MQQVYLGIQYMICPYVLHTHTPHLYLTNYFYQNDKKLRPSNSSSKQYKRSVAKKIRNFFLVADVVAILQHALQLIGFCRILVDNRQCIPIIRVCLEKNGKSDHIFSQLFQQIKKEVNCRWRQFRHLDNFTFISMKCIFDYIFIQSKLLYFLYV